MSAEPVYMYDPTRHYAEQKHIYDSRIQAVIDSGKFILGPEVTQLEEQCARYVNTKHAIGVASGTDALLIALMAIDVGPGDEILTVPFTWISTAEVVKLLNAIPTFCDINNQYLMDHLDLAKKITARTKAIIPVSMFGQAIDVDAITHIVTEAEKKFGTRIYIIEDAAQSFGAVGCRGNSCSFGDIACTSFFPTKPLGGFGDGGMCFTHNDELAKKMVMIRNHGCAKRYQYERVGVNGRLDTLQAAILLAKFNFLDDFHEKRNEKAVKYSRAFSEMKGVQIPEIGDYTIRHVWAQYTIQVSDEKTRDELVEFLKQRNIFVSVFYPVQLHLVQCLTSQYREGDMPVSERLGKVVLSLPVYPELTDHEQNRVISGVREFFDNY